MKKVAFIKRALSYANYMSEVQIVGIINRIANSEMSDDGSSLDELITAELNRDGNNSKGFVEMCLNADIKKNIYLHSGVSVGLKEYFIDISLDHLINNEIENVREVNFNELSEAERRIMDTFFKFCETP